MLQAHKKQACRRYLQEQAFPAAGISGSAVAGQLLDRLVVQALGVEGTHTYLNVVGPSRAGRWDGCR